MSAIRKDLTAFPVEVSFAPIELDGRRLVGAFIRDTTAATRVELLLLAINRVNRALLANLNPREIYALIAGEGRMLLGGALGTVVVPGHRPGLMVIAGAANEDFGYLVGLELDPGSSAAGRAIDSGQTIRIADLALSGNVHSDGSSLGLGPAIIVPIAADETCIGALSIVRKNSGRCDRIRHDSRRTCCL